MDEPAGPAPAPAEAGAGPLGADEWVRTRDGWEKAVWRKPPTGFSPHPAIVAALIALASIASLVAFGPAESLAAK